MPADGRWDLIWSLKGSLKENTKPYICIYTHTHTHIYIYDACDIVVDYIRGHILYIYILIGGEVCDLDVGLR